MRRSCFLFILICSWLSASNEPGRPEFLSAYYKGDYETAHGLIHVFSDPVTRQIWEQRIHYQTGKNDCKELDTEQQSARALAELKIGLQEQASHALGEDWISCWGRSLYASWTNNKGGAREYLRKALALAPKRPELLYMAGDLAPDHKETIELFRQYLEIEKEDEVRRSIAQDTIAFLQKTEGMEIHVVSPPPGEDTFETDYDIYGSRIRALADGKEKVKLMLDTGATGLVLEKRKWEPQVQNDVNMLGLGKKQISKTSLMVLNQFQAGHFSVKNPVVTISEHLPSPDLDGLTGTAVFSTHRIVLPMKRGKDVLLLPYSQDPFEYFEKNNWKFSKKESFPFYLVEKLIIIKGRINDSPAEMDLLIDTGAQNSLIALPAAKKYARIDYALSSQLRGNAGLSGVGGVSKDLLYAQNVNVQVGSISKNFNPMTCLNFSDTSESLELELDLILGRDFLSGYTLLIDYQNRQLTFLK